MTKKERVAARARCEAATKGPWIAECRSIDNPGNDPNWPDDDFLQFKLCGPAIVEGRGQFVGHDADFIAHARTDLPAALKALDKADSEIARLEATIAELEKRI
jgi:hypothetical protein